MVICIMNQFCPAYHDLLPTRTSYSRFYPVRVRMLPICTHEVLDWPLRLSLSVVPWMRSFYVSVAKTSWRYYRRMITFVLKLILYEITLWSAEFAGMKNDGPFTGLPFIAFFLCKNPLILFIFVERFLCIFSAGEKPRQHQAGRKYYYWDWR